MTARLALAAVAAALAAGVVACSEPPPPAPPPPAQPAQAAVGKLTLVGGQVTLRRSGETPRPAKLEPLFDSDVVATGSDGRAVLQLSDGRELELAEDSAFRLGDARGVDLDFEEGVIAIVQDGRGAAVLTPYGRAEVQPGTRARLDSKQKSLSIEILTGGIVTVGRDGGALTTRAGQRLDLEVGEIRVVDAKKKKGKLDLEVLEVRLVMDKGAAELKEQGGKGFKKSGGVDALAQGTEFRVAGSSRARLSAKGAELVLLPGARGSFLGAEQDENGTSLKVALKAGSAVVRFSGEQPATVLVEGSAVPARLTASAEATALVAQSPKGPRVQVLTGKIELTSKAGEPVAVEAGEGATLAGGQVKVAPTGRPEVVLPLEPRLRVFSSVPREVGLGLGDEPVRVEVAADGEFKQVLSSGTASGVLPTRPVGSDLHWRILDAQGKPQRAGHIRFLPERVSRGSEKAGKTEVVSQNGQKATVVFQEQPPALTFEFPEVPGAKTYRLKVYRWGELSTPVLTTDVNAPRATLASGELEEGNYAWAGIGVDERGTEKSSGKMNQMEIIYDNSYATLAIHTPVAGPAGRSQETATGVAPLGSKLFINGKSVPLDAKGRFQVEVGRARPLVFRCVLARGAEDYLVR